MNPLVELRKELAWKIRARNLLRGEAETYRLMAEVKKELKDLDERYRQRLKALLHE